MDEFNPTKLPSTVKNINSDNISMVISRCMNMIGRPEVPYVTKLGLIKFICDKLYNLYKLKNQNLEIIAIQLSNILKYADDMHLRDRMSFFSFRDENVVYRTAVCAYMGGARPMLPLMAYLQILKYILVTKPRDPVCFFIFETLEELFIEPGIEVFTKMDIADIFFEHGKTQRGQTMLNTIRRQENQATENRNPIKIIPTIYTDTQNVHTTKINTSVLKACAYLIRHKSPDVVFNEIEIINKLIGISPSKSKIINTVMDRVSIDLSRFSADGDNMFSLHDVFSALVAYIKDHEYSVELYSRLIEEMESMSLYCSTGHLSRLINVIQGYSDVDELCIRISDDEQIHAVVSRYLNSVLMYAGDDVMDALSSDDKTPFYKFLVIKMNVRIQELCDEYGDIQMSILKAVKNYSKSEHWSIKNNRLVFDLS
jgi:hypothetical protein